MARERPALLAFGDATGRHASWRDGTGWGAAGDANEDWVGISLDAKGTGRVGALRLSANGLSGALGPAGDALFPALGLRCWT